jgi:hypothetical protein
VSDCPENEALVAYIYEECEAPERAQVERHLQTCAACAEELDGFAALRGTLRQWAPPDARLGFRVVADGDAADPAGAQSLRGWWLGALRPAWGVALAATAVVVAGAAIASVEVRYGDGGFVFRMGSAEPDVGEAQPMDDAAELQPVAAADETPPWRAELAALEAQLRQELMAQRTDVAPAAGRSLPAIPGAAMDAGDGLLREVRALMAESERRQRQEFASGLMRLAQEVDLHRQADQLRMQQEVDSLADYMVRVAQQ